METKTYHQKGTAVRSFREYADSRLGSGTFDGWAKTVDPNWNGQVMRSFWYDMRIVEVVFRNLAEALKLPLRDVVTDCVRDSVEQDLGTVAQAFLTLLDPKPTTILTMLPRFISGVIDFGRLKVIENDAGRYVLEFGGVPEHYYEFPAASVRGVISAMLGKLKHRLTGYTFSDLKPDSEQPGCVMFQCEALYEPMSET